MFYQFGDTDSSKFTSDYLDFNYNQSKVYDFFPASKSIILGNSDKVAERWSTGLKALGVLDQIPLEVAVVSKETIHIISLEPISQKGAPKSIH